MKHTGAAAEQLAQRPMQSQTSPVSPLRRMALRFISGKYQGGEIPLHDRPEFIVGRTSDLDIVLVEEMVSRRHAKFSNNDRGLFVEDLGSTNGTFVNGERIKQQTALREGDRVLIGTSIVKVVVADETSPIRRPDEPRASLAPRAQTRTMSGAIDEIPLPDLLQLFGSSRKTGVLIVRMGDDIGKLYLDRGVVSYAVVNDSDEVPPLKSVFRILSWSSGTFDFESSDEHVVAGSPLNATVQEILMEGLRQLDEFNAIRHKLPGLDTRVTVPQPLLPKLRDLTPVELEVLQTAWAHGQIGKIMDRAPATDLDTTKALLKLLSGGYLTKLE